MQKKYQKKSSAFLLCIILAFIIALSAAGCKDTADNGSYTSSADENESAVSTEDNVLGEGSREFLFTVTGQDGSETQFEIHTDQETVGEALTELELIDGEEGKYGLYVKTVNGITADYDKDGVYWAFYINDEYADSGVDSTPITEGDSYSFKME